MLDTSPKFLRRRFDQFASIIWCFIGFAAGPVMAIAGLQMTIAAMVIIGLVLLSGLFLPQKNRHFDLVSLAGLMIFCLWGRLTQQDSLNPHETDSLLRKCAFILVPIWLALPLLSSVRLSWRHALAAGLRYGMVVAVFLIIWDVQNQMVLQRWVQHVAADQPLGINIFNRAMLGVAILSIPAAGLWIRHHQQALGIFLPLALFAISFQTDCQTATLGLGVAGTVAILSRFSPKWTWRGVMFIFAFGVTMAVPLAYGLAHSGLIEADWLMLSARHRIEIWAYTASHIQDHLWWGHGLGASERFFPLAREMSILLPPQETMQHKHPHSLVMQVWLEGGVFGAGCLLALGYWLMICARRLSAFGQYLAVVTFAAVIAMMSISSFAIWHSWLLAVVGLAVLMVKLADQVRPVELARDLHSPDHRPEEIIKPAFSIEEQGKGNVS